MTMLAPNLRSIVDQDGAAILNSSRNQITTLDAMGGYIWRQIEQGMTQEEIVRHLVEETGEDAEMIERDVQELFQDLASRSLLIDLVPSGRSSEAL